MAGKTDKNESYSRKKSRARAWWDLCPARHLILILAAALTGLYFVLRLLESTDSPRLSFMNGPARAALVFACDHIARPWQTLASRICGFVPFSVWELFIIAVLGALALYLVISLILLIFCAGRPQRLYRLIMTFLSVFMLIFCLICWLWGSYYVTSDFTAMTGISPVKSTPEQLQTVCMYFADMANDLADDVPRDADGLFREDEDMIFGPSADLYLPTEAAWPALSGPSLAAKPVCFSRVLSVLGYTGGFSPLTGEANVNTDFPQALLPVTIAHELAHQRGVAAEDEANFTAVLACMNGGNAQYRYSAAVFAYIHLGNALYDADRDLWRECYDTLSEPVRADLDADNAYWDSFDSPAEQAVEEASTRTYDSFLRSQGETSGMDSYGECVDLLVAYYLDAASAG